MSSLKNSTTNFRLYFLFIAPDRFPPYRVDVDVLFAKILTERGHKIDWILQSNTPLHRNHKLSWYGGLVYVGSYIKNRNIFTKFVNLILGIYNDLNMFSLVKSNAYDFIQVRDKFISALPALFLSRRNHLNFIYWLSYPHAEALTLQIKDKISVLTLVNFFRGSLMRYLLYRFILPRADHIFVQSDQMKRQIMLEGISPDKMTPVPMGIHPKDLPSSIKYSNSTNDKCVVYLGTMLRIRKLDFLIRTFSIVLKSFPDAKLYMIGKGDKSTDIDF